MGSSLFEVIFGMLVGFLKFAWAAWAALKAFFRDFELGDEHPALPETVLLLPVPRVICPSGRYYCVYTAAPGQRKGLYSTKRAFAVAVEINPGSYKGLRSESIVLHPEVDCPITGFGSIAEATAAYQAATDSLPVKRW